MGQYIAEDPIMVKETTVSNQGRVTVGSEYAGQTVRISVEVVDEPENDTTSNDTPED